MLGKFETPKFNSIDWMMPVAPVFVFNRSLILYVLHLQEEQKGEMLRVLLYRHKYVADGGFKLSGLKRNMSQRSLNVSPRST